MMSMDRALPLHRSCPLPLFKKASAAAFFRRSTRLIGEDTNVGRYAFAAADAVNRAKIAKEL
jgi:hypothetical protein